MSGTPRTIRFTLNGRGVEAAVAPHLSLVDLLREQFDLFGARESCAQGLCGCCTVLVNGDAVSSCLYLAAFADGAEVVTVEHLVKDGKLDPVQEAFIETGAFQCGFCTPGFVIMTKQLLDEHPEPSDNQIRHYLSGNLCRCGAYPPALSVGQSVPLWRLSRDHPGSKARGPQTRSGLQRIAQDLRDLRLG